MTKCTQGRPGWPSGGHKSTTVKHNHILFPQACMQLPTYNWSSGNGQPLTTKSVWYHGLSDTISFRRQGNYMPATSQARLNGVMSQTSMYETFSVQQLWMPISASASAASLQPWLFSCSVTEFSYPPWATRTYSSSELLSVAAQWTSLQVIELSSCSGGYEAIFCRVAAQRATKKYLVNYKMKLSEQRRSSSSAPLCRFVAQNVAKWHLHLKHFATCWCISTFLDFLSTFLWVQTSLLGLWET